MPKPKAKSTKPRKPSQASVNRGFKEKYGKLHGQYTGFHSNTVTFSLPRSYGGERRTQFLTHLATTMKEWYSSLPNQSEIEVQIALVNGEYLFISSNKNATAERLYKEFLRYSVTQFQKDNPSGEVNDEDAPTIMEGLMEMTRAVKRRSLASKATDAPRQGRHASKLQAALDGRRKDVEALNLRFDGEKACLEINATEDVGTTVRDFITGALPDKRVAMVTAGREMHAEQKILLALCKACMSIGDQVSVVFAGTFRPCRGCFESLNLVQRYLIGNLTFGSRPGHFWRTTTCAHQMIRDMLVANGKISPHQAATDFDSNGLLLGLTDVSYRPNLRVSEEEEDVEGLHYASESDSDWED